MRDQFRIFFGSVIYCSKFNVLMQLREFQEMTLFRKELTFREGWVGVNRLYRQIDALIGILQPLETML